MNILPHKSWHVRTKANIARVRRDEAKAAEEEKLRQKRIELAEKEARTNLLRERARSKYDGRASADSDSCDIQSGAPDKHINFFEELEKGEANIVKGNRDYEQEKKEEQEKYEKKIGYLTYLGQDTVESTGNISWFNKLPERLTNNKDNTEVNIDKKALIDPINKLKCFSKTKT
ncbi:hypothetical protein O3M35_011224 [Rhynocoris fuscipes]|uniref:CBF1-interacting co-repressor CIR N-terminal domain-containing protein n=1 Tax=Rhynocoris fuscipes TaxID=488301 RepID=A0AAW1CWS1_9HEMI